MIDKTCLSYWFPLIAAAGLPVPRTTIVRMPNETLRDVWRLFDGHPLTDVSAPFFRELRDAADDLGYPCFLRSGQTSAKHDWERTCYLPDGTADLISHVAAIIEYGECASLFGLPANVWAVREYLPVQPVAVCASWGMPVVREYRAFVRDGAVECLHPYWPLEALEQGRCPDAEAVFGQLYGEQPCPEAVELLAARTGAAVGGYWSVDVLETDRGLVVTDLAEGEKSFHWPGCPNEAPR